MSDVRGLSPSSAAVPADPVGSGALAPASASFAVLVPAFDEAPVIPDLVRELHPALAAAAMALSSTTVVVNSLSLSRRKLPST